MDKHYDIIVVGAGSGAKLAYEAADHGYKVAHIEKGPFGGTCVNRGCIPSKMTIYPADVMRIVETSAKLNLKIPEPEVEYANLIDRVTGRVDGIAKDAVEKYQKKDNLDVYTTEGKFVADREMEVGGDHITADRVYLGIGARSRVPNIPGLEGTPYLTSETALRLRKRPEKMVMIGGGFIGAEMGHFFATYGVEVEILARSTFLKGLDNTICRPCKEYYRKHHKLVEGVSFDKVSYENNLFTVTYHHEGKEMTAQGDALLIATGVVPWTDHLGIENTSIQLDKKGFIQVDDHLQTTAPGTYAFGDCTGHALFRHMANFDRNYLLDQLFHRKPEGPIQYPPIPFAIFSHPQIGVVGKTEEEFEKEGRGVLTGVAEYKDCAMGMARLSEIGMAKLIFDVETHKLLSAHIMGDEASSLIQILIAYIQMGATLADITETVFIHPALPEVVYFAALDAESKVPSRKKAYSTHD